MCVCCLRVRCVSVVRCVFQIVHCSFCFERVVSCVLCPFCRLAYDVCLARCVSCVRIGSAGFSVQRIAFYVCFGCVLRVMRVPFVLCVLRVVLKRCLVCLFHVLCTCTDILALCCVCSVLCGVLCVVCCV